MFPTIIEKASRNGVTAIRQLSQKELRDRFTDYYSSLSHATCIELRNWLKHSYLCREPNLAHRALGALLIEGERVVGKVLL